MGAGDVVDDSDGQGTIYFDGVKVSGLTLTGWGQTGLYKANDTLSGYYDAAAGTLQLFSNASALPLSCTIEHFTPGAYGITLKEAPAQETDWVLTGMANNDEMSILDGLIDPFCNNSLVAGADTSDDRWRRAA